MDEQTIEEFWNANPCGEQFVDGVDLSEEHQRFFEAYDRYRYRTEDHILGCLDALAVYGKEVLEIGLGQGADSEQLIRRGAKWSGLDLTAESVARVKTRLSIRSLPFEDIRRGSALSIPWPADSFDLVYSHGVLHHIPKIKQAQSEIHRVLRSDGELVAMLYARRSLNYLFAIFVVRRLALLVLYPLYRRGLRFGRIIDRHLENASRESLLRYLRMKSFIHRSTDGPDNPFSRVYDLDDVKRDFPDFEITATHRHFMHAPPLPRGLPFESRLGWHLWVHLKPRQTHS